MTNTGDSSVLTSGSLRAAILNADASPGSTINFNIGASGVVETITPASALPAITAAVTIDATTETGYTSSPLINLNGAGLNANGLQITASNTHDPGPGGRRFGQTGILINGGATGDLITNDFMGTNATGTAAAANAIGIEISGSANNTLNTDLVSGNTGNGVVITGSGSTGNVVVSCKIGTNAAGTAALANGGDGVLIGGASGNTIGGTVAGARNIISGNRTDGVEITARHDRQHGRRQLHRHRRDRHRRPGQWVTRAIGVVRHGAGQHRRRHRRRGRQCHQRQRQLRRLVHRPAPRAATWSRATTSAPTPPAPRPSATAQRRRHQWRRRPTTPSAARPPRAGNVICGNAGDGVEISGAARPATWSRATTSAPTPPARSRWPTAAAAITSTSATSNTIGGTAAGAGNVISGNAGNGSGSIRQRDQPRRGQLVEGNYIGTNAAGNAALANGGDGIFASAAANTIGGTAAGAGNIIRGQQLLRRRDRLFESEPRRGEPDRHQRPLDHGWPTAMAA